MDKTESPRLTVAQPRRSNTSITRDEIETKDPKNDDDVGGVFPLSDDQPANEHARCQSKLIKMMALR